MAYKKYSKKSSGTNNRISRLEKKVSKIDTTIERKFIDKVQNATQLVPDSWLSFPLLEMTGAQGVTDGERIGNNVTMTSLAIRATLDASALNSRSYARVLVVQFPNNVDAISNTDVREILEYNDPTTATTLGVINSPFKTNSKLRYKVLSDQRIGQDNEGISSVKFINKRFSFKNLKQSVLQFATTLDTQPQQNNIGLYIVSDNLAQFSMTTRLYYQDA